MLFPSGGSCLAVSASFDMLAALEVLCPMHLEHLLAACMQLLCCDARHESTIIFFLSVVTPRGVPHSCSPRPPRSPCRFCSSTNGCRLLQHQQRWHRRVCCQVLPARSRNAQLLVTRALSIVTTLLPFPALFWGQKVLTLLPQPGFLTPL